MRRLALLVVLPWLPSLAAADRLDEFKPYPGRRVDTTAVDAENGTAKLVAAIRRHDARAVQKQLAAKVSFEGAWFADTACRKRFGKTDTLKGNAQLSQLARCLAGMKLQLSTRKSARDDGAVLTADPGIEMELQLEGTKITFIGFAGQPDHNLAPALTAQAFEALRTAGTTNLDVLVGKQLEPTVERSGSTSAWVRICLDKDGAVTSTKLREVTPSLPIVEQAFAAAIRDWKFKPFSPGGVAQPACSMSLLSYPAASAPEVEVLPAPVMAIVKNEPETELWDEEGEGGVIGGVPAAPPPPPPPPPAPPQNVAPSALEANRIAGTKAIEPDAPTKAAIKKSGKDKVVVAFKICLDLNGAVSHAVVLKSSGFPAYDKTIKNTMTTTWRFTPWVSNNKIVAVCTAETFIYSTK